MGRFQYKDDDDDDNSGDHESKDENHHPTTDSHHREWNFVASPGEDGSLVVRQYSDNDGYFLNEESSDSIHEQTSDVPNRRTVFVVYQQHPPPSQQQQQGNNGTELFDPCYNNYYDRQGYGSSEGRTCCPLWIKITLVAFLCNLIWYGWQEGPPAPPHFSLFSIKQEDHGNNDSPIDMMTWNEYLGNHVSDLVTSGTALFVNLPYHVISWWSVHVHSDLYEIYEQWNKPRPCVLEWDRGHRQQQQQQQQQQQRQHDDDEMDQRLSLCFATQSQKLAVQKLKEGLQAWRWDMRLSPRPLVLLSSSMTAGLDPEGLGECLIRQVLFPSCTTTTKIPPIQKLEMHRAMDSMALRSKLIQALTPWQGHGGLVILSSVDKLSDDTLEWMLWTLTAHGVDDIADDTDRIWIQSLAQRVIFLVTSEEIGRPSLIRHTREDGPIASLMLDLRHEWQVHGANWKSGAAILPFLAIGPEQVQSFARVRLRGILDGWTVHFVDNLDVIGETLVPPTEATKIIFMEDTVVEALTAPDVVEYVAWSADFDGQERYIMTFSSAGVQPVKEKVHWLAGRIGVCFEDDWANAKDMLLILKYDHKTSRMVLKRCSSTAVSSCIDVCSFPVI